VVVWDVEDEVVDDDDEDDCIGVVGRGIDIVIEIREIDEL
jgi:hypothetical protein